MKDPSKTKQELIEEISALKKKIKKLENSESKSMRAEEALRESEATLRTLINAPTDSILLLDTRGVILDLNNVAAERLGKKRDELIGTLADNSLPDDIAKKRRALITHVLETGKTVRFEDKRNVMWFDVVAYPVKDQDDQVSKIAIIARDISERKQLEESLRESESKYRFITDNIADIIWTTDMNLNFTYESPSVQRVRGFTVEEALSQKMYEVLAPASLQYALNVLEEENKALLGNPDRIKDKLTLELEEYCKDGSTIWTENEVKYLPGQDGKPIGIIGATRDISARKRAEKALTNSEEKFRKAFYTSPDVVSITRLEDGMYISINPGFTRIMGYTEKDIIGKTSTEYNIWDNIEDRQILIAGLKKDGVVNNLEAAFRTKDDEIRYGLVSSSMIDLNGVPHILGVVRDITERKRMDETLRQSEERYKHLFNNAQVGLFHSRLSDGRILACNARFARGLGYSTPEECCADYVSMKHYVNSEDRSKILGALLKQGQVVDFELEVTKRDGTPVWANLSAIIYPEKGLVECAVVNIADRKRMEEEKRRLEEHLQRAEKMEALGLLAGGVAHDLNNVLGIVVGYTELLLNEVGELSPIKPRLAKIMNGSEKAAAIVQDLLTLVRRGVSGRKVLNLNKIILDCQNSPELEKLSSHHFSVRIKLDLKKDLLNISGSSVHLGKALFNLLANALEAMPKGGDLTIKTTNQYLDKPIHGYDNILEGDYVVLSVSDTGEGIPESDLKRIFEPFYTKKVMGKSGTGLGLAVVWGTVKDHQGYINVQSEEGKGTIFTLYFPVTREQISGEAASVSISEYMGQGEDILVVDDVREQRELAAEMLRKLNYKTTSVGSGEGAVEYLKEHKVDLLVLDMIMEPGMDGLDTYKRILEIHPEQKAIIVSGFSESERVNEAHILGAGAYVKKPYVIEKLGMAVRKELDRK